MRRRRRKPQTDDPIPDLVALAEQWHQANWRQDTKTATAARRRADQILKAHPQYIDRPPMGPNRARRVSKDVFIKWERFIGY